MAGTKAFIDSDLASVFECRRQMHRIQSGERRLQAPDER